MFLADREYHHESYSRLLKSDHQQPLPKKEFCHLLCAVNRTCAAVLYNDSICYMSGVPDVVNTSSVEYNALVKRAFFTSISVTVIEGWCLLVLRYLEQDR